MKKISLSGMVIGVLAAICGCATVKEEPADLVVRGDGIELKFAEVNGTSRLPLEYLGTGKQRDKVKDFTLRAYWITTGPLTRRQFAAVMGSAGEVADSDEPIDNVDWCTAIEFCRRFNARYADSIPEGYMLTLPTIYEWAHAVRIIEREARFVNPVGTLLFNGNEYGRIAFTYGDDRADSYDITADVGFVGMHERREGVGIRPIIAPIASDTVGHSSLTVTRCTVLAVHGRLAEARELIELALEKGELSAEEEEWTKELQKNCSDEECPYAFDDWLGILLRVGELAEGRGYSAKPIVEAWFNRGDDPYRNYGIEGRMTRIGDLPPEIIERQGIGDYKQFYVNMDGSFPYGHYLITSNTLVQVLACDFTGDGKRDLVVEQFGAEDSLGYRYDFFERGEDDIYRHVCNLQTIGLCPVPAKDGGACGFLVVTKDSNPIVSTGLMTYADGEMTLTDTEPKSYYLIDARKNEFYVPAPFVGDADGYLVIEANNVWYRPLFWPWESPDAVQGYDEVYAEALKQKERLDGAKNELHQLREKWPNAGKSISAWEKPEFASVYRAYRDFQDNSWRHDSAESTLEFEALVRKVIDAKLDPEYAYYNLACALACREQKEAALETLEQAVAAGYANYDHASYDEDFASIREEPRFKRLVELMCLNETGEKSYLPAENLVLSNGEYVFTARNSAYSFEDGCFISECANADEARISYLDMEGIAKTPEGLVRARYESKARKSGIDRGLGKHVVRVADCCMPMIVRGKFSAEEVKTDAFDARELAKSNVLGLYSAEECAEAPTWCVLYDGPPEDGLRLAEIILKGDRAMSFDAWRELVVNGEYVSVTVRQLHQAMKEATDGPVIKVENIDVEKYMAIRRELTAESAKGLTPMVE